MEILVSEHAELACYPFIAGDSLQQQRFQAIVPRLFPSKYEKRNCYNIRVCTDAIYLKADYYVGVDWLIEDEHFIHVKPKLNTKVLARFKDEVNKTEQELSTAREVENEPSDLNEGSNYRELDYFKLLLQAFAIPEVARNTDDLIVIDWERKHIPITQKDDTLTPFLVVQFLNMVKHIVRKGLKKSYYKVRENLTNRVKGKILVSVNIKQNVLKNRLTKTFCEYQEFGIDHDENRFLKKVVKYCSNYVHQNSNLFGKSQTDLEQLISYCNPAFEMVSDDITSSTLRNIKYNPFFKEYQEAIKIGGYILKRFAYNISSIASQHILTPPFWIDMTKLFELYVYRYLLTVFKSDEIKYQFPTYGNILDFLVTKEGSQMVVDAKYKMHYRTSHIHQDVRQLAGYARLTKVYEKLKRDPDKILDCLIIYPEGIDINESPKFEGELTDKHAIQAYQRVFKIGIPMPYM